jgi:hypothetical protein
MCIVIVETREQAHEARARGWIDGGIVELATDRRKLTFT